MNNLSKSTCSNSLPVVQVSIASGKPTVTSLQVAEAFGKRHDNVITDIRTLAISQEFALLNFQECSYTNGNNRPMPMFTLTRDGFMFLAMGYTGEKAAALKEAYITEFNRMEAELANRSAIALPPDYASALRALADSVEQKTIAEAQLAITAPKAAVYDTAIADKEMSVASFCRRLRGVSITSVKNDLCIFGYLWKAGKTHHVRSPYRDSHFEEKMTPYGQPEIMVLDKGKQLLTKLYLDGRLTMRKNFKGILEVVADAEEG